MLFMTPVSTPTTEQSNLMRRLGCESEGWGGSNQRSRRSDSWVPMPQLAIYSILVGILYPPAIIEKSGQMRLDGG